MPDFAPYMQHPTLDSESLRGTLISLIHQDPVLRGRPAAELDRAVSDVIAGQLVPSTSRMTAYQQVVAGFVAVLLRLAGANPSSILNELQSRDVDDQLTLMGNILMRMVPEPATSVSLPDDAVADSDANATRLGAAHVSVLGENGTATTSASHARMLNVGVHKPLAQSVEHAVPLRATPIGQRPPESEAMLVRLEVLPGVSVDIDESMQRVMRKPERRAEVMNEIAARLEKYFGG
jgi:hypothetical protein